MSEQSDTPGGNPGAPRQDSGNERDLSFLWPVIDRIRAVEIKFIAESGKDGVPAAAGPAQQPDLEARLTALTAEVAALRRMLQGAPGVVGDGTAAAAPATGGTAIVLTPQRWPRVAAAAVATVLLLLVAHWLIVFTYDKPTVLLRLASIAIPLPIAIWLTLRHPILPWLQVLYGFVIGAVAVFGMAYVTSIHEHTSFLPENMREWQETLEYIASIMFAHLTGALTSSAMQVRSGTQNRAGAATLRLVQVIAFVTGRAIASGPTLKKHVDTIHSLVSNLMPMVSAIMAIITGIKGILG